MLLNMFQESTDAAHVPDCADKIPSEVEQHTGPFVRRIDQLVKLGWIGVGVGARPSSRELSIPELFTLKACSVAVITDHPAIWHLLEFFFSEYDFWTVISI